MYVSVCGGVIVWDLCALFSLLSGSALPPARVKEETNQGIPLGVVVSTLTFGRRISHSRTAWSFRNSGKIESSSDKRDRKRERERIKKK
jgi:hypothetical protein